MVCSKLTIGQHHDIDARSPDDSPPEVILGHGESGKLREGFKHASFQKRETALFY
jgi:hypothetical protein